MFDDNGDMEGASERMRAQSLPVLEHQKRELRDAAKSLDGTRPGATHDLHNAIAAAGASQTYARIASVSRSLSAPLSSPCLLETAAGMKKGGSVCQRRNICDGSAPIVFVR